MRDTVIFQFSKKKKKNTIDSMIWCLFLICVFLQKYYLTSMILCYWDVLNIFHRLKFLLYRCKIRNLVGTIVSREVIVRGGEYFFFLFYNFMAKVFKLLDAFIHREFIRITNQAVQLNKISKWEHNDIEFFGLFN